MREFPLAIRIAEVERELKKRPQVYDHLVRQKKMRRSVADHQIAIMRDVLNTLIWLREHESFFTECLRMRQRAKELSIQSFTRATDFTRATGEGDDDE